MHLRRLSSGYVSQYKVINNQELVRLRATSAGVTYRAPFPGRSGDKAALMESLPELMQVACGRDDVLTAMLDKDMSKDNIQQVLTGTNVVSLRY